jgi:hypothetical protein
MVVSGIIDKGFISSQVIDAFLIIPDSTLDPIRIDAEILEYLVQCSLKSSKHKASQKL